MLLELADGIESTREELAAARVAERREAARSRASESPSSADNLRFFAGAARILEGKAAGEYMRGYTSMIRPRADRRRRPDRALELPADDGDLEDRPGARGRQLGVLKPSERRR